MMMRLFCNIFQVTNLLAQRHVTQACLIGFVYTKVSVMGRRETFFSPISLFSEKLSMQTQWIAVTCTGCFLSVLHLKTPVSGQILCPQMFVFLFPLKLRHKIHLTQNSSDSPYCFLYLVKLSIFSSTD